MFLPQDFSADLLAPGDTRAAALNAKEFTWDGIRTTRDPNFQIAYDALWAEFGVRNEMEQITTLEGRFKLAPAMLYEMLLVRKDGVIAGVRDHTAVWADDEVIVHLSHNLVMPDYRRSGLAGWLRAAPILTAIECGTMNGSPHAPITLVGEMEYPDGANESAGIRLHAYEKAGFLKADPSVLHYFQPDFRLPSEIDASGGAKPLPFQLIIRRVENEKDQSISGAQLRKIVSALYRMYGAQFRPQDMAHPLLDLNRLPDDATAIPLLPPSSCHVL